MQPDHKESKVLQESRAQLVRRDRPATRVSRVRLVRKDQRVRMESQARLAQRVRKENKVLRE